MMKHLQRVSSIVRGEQIAAYMLNARLNPEHGYENDVCIYVKPHIKPGSDFDFPKHSWIDIQDGKDLVSTLEKYPNVGVIAYSDEAYKYLSKGLNNKIALIPHPHLNFERRVRNRTTIKKVGTTGSFEAFEHIPDIIKEGLQKRGIKFEFYSLFYPRMAVSKFHESLDVHIHWRPFRRRRLSAPFKIINSASFGVPTIALDEPSFKEVGDINYIGVKTPEEWLAALDMLIESPITYENMAKSCIEMSEKYHISNIAKLYEALT